MNNVNRKLFFAVDYRYADGATTFDIFTTLEKAETYVHTFNDPSNVIPTRIWCGDFDTEMVYQEPDGDWNYDEFANMVTNEKTIRILNEQFPVHYMLN